MQNSCSAGLYGKTKQINCISPHPFRGGGGKEFIMNTFSMIMNGETKIEELSVTNLFICYTGAKQYLAQELELRNTTIKMMHDSATKKGILNNDNSNDDSDFIFNNVLSVERDGYHHITNNKNISFYIPNTEDISQYAKHNELIGKYLNIVNKCANRIHDGGYMEMFFDVESGEFSL